MLNIRSEEWPRLVFLYGMALVALIGIGWGETIVVAAFLNQAGVQFLPWAFVISAVASIGALFVYTGFADHVPNDKLFIWILGISGVGIVVGLVLLSLHLAVGAYLLLYLILSVPLADVYNVHWATYVNGYYDTRAAKRVIPVLSTSTRVAGIVAGLTMPLLNRAFPPSATITIWLVSLAVMAAMIWLMPRVLKDKRAAGPGGMAALTPRVERPSYFRNLQQGYEYIAASPFLRSLALATLLVTIWLALINYQTSAILLDRLRSTVAIANFVGILSAIANLIALPIQLFLLSRLIGRVGLGNASLVFPAGAVAVSGGLLVAPGLLTASLGYVARTVFRTTFRSPIESLLYNAVPLRVKGRTRAFVGGLVTPIGAILGGLLLFSPVVHSSLALGVLVGIASLGVLASALVVRKRYARALIAMLEQEDYSSLLSEGASALTAADPATLNWLKDRLAASTSPEFTIFTARIISEVGGKEAIAILRNAAQTASDARVRAAIIDILASTGAQGDQVRDLYGEFLSDADANVRLSALAGLAQTTGAVDGRFKDQVSKLLDDPNIEVRAAATSLLLGSIDAATRSDAAATLEAMLAQDDPHARAQGLRLLGQTGDLSAIGRLMAFLSDPADEARLEAVLAIEALVQGDLTDDLRPALQKPIQVLLADPIERVRQAALTILGRLGTREAYAALLGALDDSSSAIRAQAADALVAAGKPAIALVHPKLNSSEARLRTMAAVILSRVDPKQFGALVESQVANDLLSIYRNYALVEALAPCEGIPSLALLRTALREQSESLRDGIFYLLGALHGPNAVLVIEDSFHSEVERVRANAAEALEAMTTPRVAGLVAPLFEPELQPAQLLALGQDAWGMTFPDPSQAMHDLLVDHDDAWLRSVAAFSLGEIGTAAAPGSTVCLPDGPDQLLELAAVDPVEGVRQAARTGPAPDSRPG